MAGAPNSSTSSSGRATSERNSASLEGLRPGEHVVKLAPRIGTEHGEAPSEVSA